MSASYCQIESAAGPAARGTILRAWTAAIGLAAICAAPAIGADWDLKSPAPALRMPDSLLSLHEMYPDLVTPKPGLADVFQPHSVFTTRAPDLDFPRSSVLERGGDLPLTSAWQRMGDFRSEDGIRLLTVWQSANSTLALHQGKHGGASLQWTVHGMNRGGASRGLFDHLVSSVREARAPLRLSSPPATASATAAASRFSTP